jgi:AraC-like DNA-binding protein
MNKRMRKSNRKIDNAKHGDVFSIRKKHPFPLCPSMVGLNDCDPSYFNERPAAQLSVLGHVIGGQGTVEVGSSIWHPTVGDTFVLPKYAHQRVYSDSAEPERWVYYWINIEDDLYRDLLQSCGMGNGAVVDGPALRGMFEAVLELAQHDGSAEREPFETQTRLSSLLLEMTYRLGAMVLASERPLSPLTQEAKDYLDASLDRKVVLEDLCRQTGCSMRQLNYRFKQELGSTPHQYILQQKMALARRLLGQTDLSVSEIADSLAFPDTYYFSNIFKMKVGMSPSQYRSSAHARDAD